MTDYHQPLLPDQTYHLFSRAVGSEKLFMSADNYLFFLQKLKQHTSDVCQIYCYSLLPNHFHLLAKINDEASIIKHFEEVKKVIYQPNTHDLSDFIMERFSNFLNSYTKAFNKANKRKGSLFMDFLKRSKVNKENDFTSFLWYIHKNAVHHQLTKNIGEWQYDSYNSLISEAPTSLLRPDVLTWFGNKADFIKFHHQEIYSKIEFKDI
ncbi:MAG: transposase [Bacteroidia bacterium]